MDGIFGDKYKGCTFTKNGCIISDIKDKVSMRFGLDIYQECGMLQYKYGGIKKVKIMNGAGLEHYLSKDERQLGPYEIAVEVEDGKSQEERGRIEKDTDAAFERINHSDKGTRVIVYTDKEMVDKVNDAYKHKRMEEAERINWLLDRGRVIYESSTKLFFPYDMDFEKYMKEFMKA